MRKTPDVGDRVVVVGNTNGGFSGAVSSDLTKHMGKHGVIVHNNGCGLCKVLLDDGAKVLAWNGCDLKPESALDRVSLN